MEIDSIVSASKRVFNDCFLENGAVIAANTDKSYYPSSVANYRFVWPRDAAFALYAAKLIGIDFYGNFAKWLLERAESFAKTGLLMQRYATNGAKDVFFGYQYQPDQTGALLWSFLSYLGSAGKKNSNIEAAVKLMADSLVDMWQKDHFKITTYDLWEERKTIPWLKGNFIYTLASCSYGLLLAYEKYKNKKWLKAGNEMKKIIKDAEKKYNYYPRLYGMIEDKRIDASLLALAWPFSITNNMKMVRSTIKEIEKKLIGKKGIKRYEHDEYCSNIENGSLWKKQAGAWPLLMFWYVIALSKTGEKKKARKVFLEYVRNFGGYIPEQLFENKIQESVNGLLWSHAMFIIALKELGF